MDKIKYARQAPTPGKICKDCPPRAGGQDRPAPHPGPRCATHHREARQRARTARKEAHVLTTYGLSPDAYQELYDRQGGRCAGCRRATGTGRKRLAVDHDHRCCPGPVSCGRCIRGLLCATCNRILGRFRDDPVAFFRLGLYLINPPARGD